MGAERQFLTIWPRSYRGASFKRILLGWVTLELMKSMRYNIEGIITGCSSNDVNRHLICSPISYGTGRIKCRNDK